MRYRVGWALAIVAAPLSGQQAQSVQQAFEAANALDATGTPAARLAAWEAVEKRVVNNKRSRSVVRVRMSRALLALGRRDDAAVAIGSSLADMPNDPALRADRYVATLLMAQIEEAALDYASAVVTYRKAEALADEPGDKMSIYYGLIKAETFIDPAAAAQTVVRANALIATTKTSTAVQAEVRRLDAERLMNAGDFEGARREAGVAVKLLGGLTTQTRPDDARVRSDFGIAALLGGKPDLAREYLAMSGAGRQSKGAFAGGVSMRAPDCGSEAGLKPADLAVIEFTIDDDGTVVQSEPVYAAGGGLIALEFARAVREWSWTPEQVKAIPLFFRYHTRVEMRCSTGFERPSILTYLDAGLGAWLTGKGVALPEPATGSDAAALPVQRRDLAQLEAASGSESLALVPVLQLIARNRVTPRPEANAAATRAFGIVVKNGATGIARLATEVGVWDTAGAETDEKKVAERASNGLSSTEYANDSDARTALRIVAANAYRRQPARARPFLTAIAADGALPATHPLRAAALVQLASLEQAAGNAEAARAAFVKSGLDATQCSLVDAPPRFLRAGGTFPEEAVRWGFEGWTRIQFDIDAAGAVRNERVVMAYPPFVFSQAGAKTLADARYAKSYRPDGGLGCGGSQQNVVFSMPGLHN